MAEKQGVVVAEETEFGVQVAVTHAAGEDAHKDLTGPRGVEQVIYGADVLAGRPRDDPASLDRPGHVSTANSAPSFPVRFHMLKWNRIY